MERDVVKEGKEERSVEEREREGARGEEEGERGCLVETKEQKSISKSEFSFQMSRKREKVGDILRRMQENSE